MDKIPRSYLVFFLNICSIFLNSVSLLNLIWLNVKECKKIVDVIKYETLLLTINVGQLLTNHGYSGLDNEESLRSSRCKRSGKETQLWVNNLQNKTNYKIMILASFEFSLLRKPEAIFYL